MGTHHRASAIDELARKLDVNLPICGSRTTFATGMAVIQACEDIIAQCKQRAALTWDLDEEQVDWVDGEAIPKPGVNADVKPLSLADIVRGAGRTGGPLLSRAGAR